MFEEVARLHKRVLKDSILSGLSLASLAEIYEELVKDNNNILLTTKREGEITGFIFATKNSQVCLKNLLRRKFWKIVLYFSEIFLSNPALLFSLWGLFRKTNEETAYPAELQFFAVDPRFQNMGLGQRLLRNLDKSFEGEGIKRYRAGVRERDFLANKFYISRGFRLFYRKKVFGDVFNFYSHRVKLF